MNKRQRHQAKVKRRGGAPIEAVRGTESRMRVVTWVCTDPRCWACRP